LAAAALAAASAGCMGAAAVLPPAREVFQLETWTNVPQGHDEARAKVGEVLHLPLGPAADLPPLVYLRVEINGKPVEFPEFHTSLKSAAYVFRARQPGHYRVEVHRDFGLGKPRADSSAARDDAPKDTSSSWPPRVWEVIISG
jgi:hypothetical protein